MARVRPRDRITGHREAIAIAATLGGIIRSARHARRWTLAQLATRVGLSISRLSDIERGAGARVLLDAWIALGIALERPLAIRFTPALTPASAIHGGHLEIQEHVLGLGRATGRSGTFELPTRPADPAWSADVGLRDPATRTRILAECWNTFGDLGAAVRSMNRKVAEASATWPDERIASVWVVRDSAANRAVVARYPAIIDAAFPGSSRQWVKALTEGGVPPRQPGLVWYDASTRRLRERRRATIAP